MGCIGVFMSLVKLESIFDIWFLDLATVRTGAMYAEIGRRVWNWTFEFSKVKLTSKNHVDQFLLSTEWLMSKFTCQHHGPETVLARLFQNVSVFTLEISNTCSHSLKETPPLYKYAYLQPEVFKMFPAENQQRLTGRPEPDGAVECR